MMRISIKGILSAGKALAATILFILTAVTASCSRETDIPEAGWAPPREDVPSRTVRFHLAGNPTGNTKVIVSDWDIEDGSLGDFQILVYTTGGWLWSSAWNEAELSCPLGACYVVALANMRRITPPSRIGELEAMTLTMAELEDANASAIDCIPMYYNDIVIVPQEGDIDISLKRVPAKVTVTKIYNDMVRDEDQEFPFYISEIFIANAPGDWTPGNPSSVPTAWYNKLGEDGSAVGASAMLRDNLDTDLSFPYQGHEVYELRYGGDPYTGIHSFYVLPNPCTGNGGLNGPWSPRRSCVVVKAYKTAMDISNDNSVYLYYRLPVLESNKEYTLEIGLSRWSTGEDFMVYPEDLGYLHYGEESREIKFRYTDNEGVHHFRSLSDVSIYQYNDDTSSDDNSKNGFNETDGHITYIPNGDTLGFGYLEIEVEDNETGMTAYIHARTHDPALDIIGSNYDQHALSMVGPKCCNSRNWIQSVGRQCPEFNRHYPVEPEDLTWNTPNGTSVTFNEKRGNYLEYWYDINKTAQTGGKTFTVTHSSGAHGELSVNILENRSSLSFDRGTIIWKPGIGTSEQGGTSDEQVNVSSKDWNGNTTYIINNPPVEFSETLPTVNGSPIMHTNLTGWTGNDINIAYLNDDALGIFGHASAPEGEYTYSMHMRKICPYGDYLYQPYWVYDGTASIRCLVGDFSGISFSRQQYSLREDKFRNVPVTYINDEGEVETGKLWEMGGDGKWTLFFVVYGKLWHSGSNSFVTKKYSVPIQKNTGTASISVRMPRLTNQDTAPVLFTLTYIYDSSSDTFSMKIGPAQYIPNGTTESIVSYALEATTTDEPVKTATARIIVGGPLAGSGDDNPGDDQEITY